MLYNSAIMDMEQKITELAHSGLGEKYNLKLSLQEVSEIPIDSFSTLQNMIRSRKAILRQCPMSLGANTFSIISTPFESKIFTLISASTIIIPLVGIICSFIFSWWFSISLFYIFYGTRLSKKVYLHAIFDRSENSEIAFCFLFCGQFITLELPEHGIIKRS